MDLAKIKQDYESRLKYFEDPKFVFEEDSHTYHYDGVKYDSVTTFLKRFKVPFDREYWLKRKSQELGVDQSVLENDWSLKASTANFLGTNVHKWIEDFWSGKNPSLPTDEEELKRVQYFLDLYEKRFKNLVPLKSELRIFSKKWRLAGTIDQPLLLWDEKQFIPLFLIGDWKTNKEFKDDKHPKGRYKKLLHPFTDLYENSHNEYSIQISIYRLILQEEIGLQSHGGFLCHLGPDGPKIYPAKDLTERLKVYLQSNREEIDIFDIK